LSTFGNKKTCIEERNLIQHLRDHGEKLVKPTFMTILAIGSRFQATDPRDYIYAFFGHPAAKNKDGTSTSIEAGDKLRFQDMCAQLAQNLANRDRRLD